jgi:hypothetical protein
VGDLVEHFMPKLEEESEKEKKESEKDAKEVDQSQQ